MLTISQRYWASKTTTTFGGQRFQCTRRTKAALYHAAAELKAHHPNALGPGKPAYIQVYQGCYQNPNAVPKSKGTHDFDAVVDNWIHGLTGAEAEAFWRWMGWAAYHRVPAEGFMEHIHMALLPPGLTTAHPTPEQVGRAYKARGLKVGRYIDGGLTSQGVTNATSQITDYMASPPRDGLADHGIDHSPHPHNINATVFRPKGY